MERSKDIIYIPYWVAGMLERNNLPLSAVLDYRKMSQFLSLQEQANMLYLQDLQPFSAKRVANTHDDEARRYELPCGGGIELTQHTSITQSELSFRLCSAWERSIRSDNNANNNELFATLKMAHVLANTESTQQAVKVRMQPENAGALKHTQAFNTYDLERDTLIVVVYPRFFLYESYASNANELLVAVLKVLYAYNSYASVCKTPYFRKYLERLV